MTNIEALVHLLDVVFSNSVHESILRECCVLNLEVAKPGCYGGGGGGGGGGGVTS